MEIDIEENKKCILNLLHSVDRKGIDNLIQWLCNETDFFNAPCSTKYHLSCPGGLSKHSLNVYDYFLLECKYHNDAFDYESRIICSLLHDICKVNTYVEKEKWRKDKNNKWESYPGYEVEDKFPVGHAEKSIILIRKFIELTDKEILAIRWHMGAFNLNQMELYGLHDALKVDPEILLLHIADWKSSVFLENDV